MHQWAFQNNMMPNSQTTKASEELISFRQVDVHILGCTLLTLYSKIAIIWYACVMSYTLLQLYSPLPAPYVKSLLWGSWRPVPFRGIWTVVCVRWGGEGSDHSQSFPWFVTVRSRSTLGAMEGVKEDLAVKHLLSTVSSVFRPSFSPPSSSSDLR